MEELEGLLGAELYSRVADKLGNVRLIVDDGKLIPKHRFDCINVSLKDHKQQVQELKRKLSGYEPVAGRPEDPEGKERDEELELLLKLVRMLLRA